jgi:hypothetical protein
VIEMSQAPTICPTLVYEDAKAAIKQLTEAFGFTEHAVYEDEDGGFEKQRRRPVGRSHACQASRGGTRTESGGGTCHTPGRRPPLPPVPRADTRPSARPSAREDDALRPGAR